MTDTILVRIPELAYLTEPEPGLFLLNLKFNEHGITRGLGPFERVQISHAQLRNIAADAVAMALRGSSDAK